MPKYTILGLGASGYSSLQYLIQFTEDIVMMDSRQQPPMLAAVKKQFPQVSITLGEFNEEILCDSETIVVSPGIDLRAAIFQQVQCRQIPIVGDIELFLRATNKPIIAITGSNGKSTVASLVTAMLNHAGYLTKLAGNIGIPALNLLSEPEPEYYVLELSSFQLESIESLQAKVACLLNISADHLDRYDSMQAYQQAKLSIFTGAQNAICYLDDPRTQPQQTSANIIYFTHQEPREQQFGLRRQDQKTYLAYGKENLLLTDHLKIRGQHNYLNALAALAIGDCCQLDRQLMLQALCEFPGLAHRCQFVARHKHVSWYNDSKATNIGATIAAIEGLADDIYGKIVLIAGGQGKGADFTELRPAVSRHIRELILYGEDAHQIEQALSGACISQVCQNLAAAVTLADQRAQAGDIILFAPACASFDMFANYVQRGEIFCQLVRDLLKSRYHVID